MAAFESEGFGGAAYVTVALVELFEDVIAFVGLAGLEEGLELFAARGGFAVLAEGLFAEDKGGEVFALNAGGSWVEDEDALDQVAQFADVAGPVVLAQRGEGVVGHLDAGDGRTAGRIRRGTP